MSSPAGSSHAGRPSTCTSTDSSRLALLMVSRSSGATTSARAVSECELPQRGEDRAVAAEHDAEVGVGSVMLDELDPLPALDAVLADLLGVEHERRARAPGGMDELAQRVGRAAVAAAVGEHGRPH